MAALRFVGLVAELAGAKELGVRLDGPKPLREILEFRLPEERTIVLINQEGGTLDSLVHDGDTVTLLPVVSGG
jgi:molybdopterin converting factor small subunit